MTVKSKEEEIRKGHKRQVKHLSQRMSLLIATITKNLKCLKVQIISLMNFRWDTHSTSWAEWKRSCIHNSRVIRKSSLASSKGSQCFGCSRDGKLQERPNDSFRDLSKYGSLLSKAWLAWGVFTLFGDLHRAPWLIWALHWFQESKYGYETCET